MSYKIAFVQLLEEYFGLLWIYFYTFVGVLTKGYEYIKRFNIKGIYNETYKIVVLLKVQSNVLRLLIYPKSASCQADHVLCTCYDFQSRDLRSCAVLAADSLTAVLRVTPRSLVVHVAFEMQRELAARIIVSTRLANTKSAIVNVLKQ